MKKILLDTNAYALFKRNDPLAVEIMRRAEFVGINVVVLAELLCGFKGGKKEEKNLIELNQFLESPRVSILQIGEETAEFYARIYWDLKRKGNPIPTNDIWVAASAVEHGLALLSFDDHFEHIEGIILKKAIF